MNASNHSAGSMFLIQWNPIFSAQRCASSMALVGRAPRMVGIPLCILGCWLERLYKAERLAGGKALLLTDVCFFKRDMPIKSFSLVIGSDHFLPASVFRDKANIGHKPIPIITVSNQEVSTIFFTSEFLLYMAPQWLSWQSG
jgi:hypothetical protein